MAIKHLAVYVVICYSLFSKTMKTTFNLKAFKPLSISFIIALLSISFTSCKKSTPEPTQASALNAINAAATSSPQDFYVDNTKVNTSAMAYTQSTGYVIISGGHQFTFETSSTSNVNNSFFATLISGQYYSLYYTDDGNVVATLDDKTAPQAGKARVRFINMSSYVNSNVDFLIAGGGTLVSGLAYKTPSIYNDVATTSTFTLNSAGTTTVLLNIPATLTAGKIYTIYIAGTTQATLSYNLVTEN